MEEDVHMLGHDPAQVRAIAYDLILNGHELASGCLRNYKYDTQVMILKYLDFSRDAIDEQFGFLVNALKYGTPPHGGIAFGLDRLAMIMARASTLSDVVAFPSNAQARDTMKATPSKGSHDQMDELHPSINKDK